MTYQQSLLASVRRSSLNLIRKMIHYAGNERNKLDGDIIILSLCFVDTELLKEICTIDHFGEKLVLVIATVFEQDDEVEGISSKLLKI